MLPPSPMLTIKNRPGLELAGGRENHTWIPSNVWRLLLLLALLAGCTPPGPRALFDGQRLIEQGKYPQAIEKLRAATLLLGGTNALAWHYLGLACQQAGEAAEVERAYRKALELDHDLSEAHYNLGCLWLAQNRIEAARGEFTACTLRRPNMVDGFLKLGAVQLRAREPSAAEKSFSEVLRLSPHNPEALNGLGLARLQRGRATEAAQCFDDALKQQPDYRPALLNLAIVSHQYLKDRQLALEKYREYLALKPPPPNAESLMATVRQLEQELNPPSRRAVTNELAQPIPKANTSKPAVTNVTRITNSPKAEPPPGSTKPAFLHNGDKTPVRPTPLGAEAAPPEGESAKRAATGGEPAVSLPSPLPNRTATRYAYRSPAAPAPGNRADAARACAQGVQAYEAHRLPEAMQAYRLAAQLDPSLFEAPYNLGLAATQAGNFPAALTAYESALAVQPRSLDARYNFALVLKQANYIADAVNELERVVVTYPNETRAHLALGNLYAQQLQQPAKARQHYSKVLEVEPRHPQARDIRYWLAANPP